jgi:hypothetical protein
MATTTTTKKPDPLTTLERLDTLHRDAEAAAETARQAEHKAAAAGLELLRIAGAAAAYARADRRGRTSAASHIEHLIGLGGPCDLTAFDVEIGERPHLWGASSRGLDHTATKLILGSGHWRNGWPREEAQLRRAMANFSQDDDFAMASELSRAGKTAYHVAALAFHRAQVMEPSAFGVLTLEQEAAAHADALELVERCQDTIRRSPTMVAHCAAELGVVLHANADPMPALVDAAAAESQRRTAAAR